jgi:hypothetical protein
MRKVDLRTFDYIKVAQIDTAMWRSYYNHKFYKLFWQMLLLLKNQLGLSWLKTIRLAYYSAWAAADYRIHRGNTNNKRIEKNLIKFYKLISDNAIEEFDYEKAGQLELIWWEVHRGSKQTSDKLRQGLAAAVAAMFNENPKKMEKYASYRAEAMFLPAHTSDKVSKTKWTTVDELLEKSWHELFISVQNN